MPKSTILLNSNITSVLWQIKLTSVFGWCNFDILMKSLKNKTNNGGIVMKSRTEARLLVLLVLSTFFSLSHINGQTGLPESKHYILHELADGIYAAIHNDEGGYAICNAGIIDLGDKTIVIDPFISPTAARDLKQHAENLTGRPVSLVLNLDPHNDHTSGNQVFVPGADIISTPNARKYIEDHFAPALEYYKKAAPEDLLQVQKQLRDASGHEKAELTLWESEDKALIESLPELKMTLPNFTINDTLIIYGSKRRIVVYQLEQAIRMEIW